MRAVGECTVFGRKVELTRGNGWTRLRNLSTMHSLYQPIRVWSAHAADVETLFVRIRGRWHCTFASLVSCQTMRYGHITVSQSIREQHQWLKRRMIGVVMIGWDEMLDAIQPELEINSENPPTPEVQKFFDMLRASKESLHKHMTVNILAFVTHLMAIKSKFTLSNKCYSELLSLINDVLPNNHKIPKDMYQPKKLLFALGMEYKKIDACKDNCMFFYKEHKDETKCLKYSKIEVRWGRKRRWWEGDDEGCS
jgi:hypothetical protein